MHGQPAKRPSGGVLAEASTAPIVPESRVFVVNPVALFKVDPAYEGCRVSAAFARPSTCTPHPQPFVCGGSGTQAVITALEALFGLYELTVGRLCADCIKIAATRQYCSMKTADSGSLTLHGEEMSRQESDGEREDHANDPR